MFILRVSYLFHVCSRLFHVCFASLGICKQVVIWKYDNALEKRPDEELRSLCILLFLIILAMAWNGKNSITLSCMVLKHITLYNILNRSIFSFISILLYAWSCQVLIMPGTLCSPTNQKLIWIVESKLLLRILLFRKIYQQSTFSEIIQSYQSELQILFAFTISKNFVILFMAQIFTKVGVKFYSIFLNWMVWKAIRVFSCKSAMEIFDILISFKMA